MKKSTSLNLVAFTLSLLAGTSAIGQQAITITAADMPVPTGAYYYDNIVGLVGNPTIATNGTWDYSGQFGNVPDFADYYPESIPFFTEAGVDVYRPLFKNLNAQFGYNVYAEFDFNAAAVDDIGLDVPAQGYDLSSFTGNVQDSLLIPAQSYIYTQPRRINEFPMTAGSAWSSNSRRTVDMQMHVPAFGLNHAPLTHAYTWVRSDSIVGWGKMRVHTPAGPSIDYDVLMAKTTEYAVDSFYLNGTPAPIQLLTAFGVAQGQKSAQNHRYQFYRKGTWAYLVGFSYGSDATFTTPQFVFVHTDDIETVSPTFEANGATYTTVLYPNPSTGSEVNVQVMGGSFELGRYVIVDAMGKMVQQGQADVEGNGNVRVRMDSVLPSGHYYISLQDKALRNVVTEQFEVIN